jgi:hypothetical protein
VSHALAPTSPFILALRDGGPHAIGLAVRPRSGRVMDSGSVVGPIQGRDQTNRVLIIAAEGGRGRPIAGCKDLPRCSKCVPLKFAHDSLILFRANGSDAQQLQSILDFYEECSGQMINREKSAVMFSPNTCDEHREQVRQALNIQKETMNERY